MRRCTPRSRSLSSRHLLALVATLALVVAVLALPPVSSAFTSTTAGPASALAADRLQPPSGLAADASCPADAIAFRGATSVRGGNGVLALTVPPSALAADVLLAQVTYSGGLDPSPPAPPGGWTRLRQEVLGGRATSAVYLRVAVAGDAGTTVTFRHSDNRYPMVGGIVAYSGVSTGNPVDVTGLAAQTSTTARTPSVTTATTNTLLVHFLTKVEDDLPAPSGTTGRWGARSEDGGNDWYAIRAFDVPFPGSGTGPVHQTTSATNLATPWTVQTVALRRAPGTPSAALSWTPSSSSWASGYRLERSAGGAVQSTRTVTSAGTASATEGPLVNGVTYTFRLWAHRGAWVSPDVTTTLTPSC